MINTGWPPPGAITPLAPYTWTCGSCFDGRNHMFVGPRGTWGGGDNVFYRVDTETFLVDGTLDVSGLSALGLGFVGRGVVFLNDKIYAIPNIAVMVRVDAWDFNFATAEAVAFSWQGGGHGGCTDGNYVYVGQYSGGVGRSAILKRIDPFNFSYSGSEGVDATSLVQPDLYYDVANPRYDPNSGYIYFLIGHSSVNDITGFTYRLGKVDPNNFNLGGITIGPDEFLQSDSAAWFIGDDRIWLAGSPTAPMRSFSKISLGLNGTYERPNTPPVVFDPDLTYYDGARFGYFVTSTLPGSQVLQMIDKLDPRQEYYYSLQGIDPSPSSYAGNIAVDGMGRLYLSPTEQSAGGEYLRFQEVPLAGPSGPGGASPDAAGSGAWRRRKRKKGPEVVWQYRRG